MPNNNSGTQLCLLGVLTILTALGCGGGEQPRDGGVDGDSADSGGDIEVDDTGVDGDMGDGGADGDVEPDSEVVDAGSDGDFEPDSEVDDAGSDGDVVDVDSGGGLAHEFRSQTSGGALRESTHYRLELFIAPTSPCGSVSTLRHGIEMGPGAVRRGNET